ncbi:hypothetical protein LEP1GSC060_1196 [Leptospira weilii serovar Ranarum str. ICFT]|uniref:Uncharacterized protein n=1 Tax=Leptospira weilii serovar Ranarum str. ICFT TaxID=1218598 RepID=N1WPA4_9LEPT|nr:hypothetical protein LEP1GSC060_1196 [Leptospira weilii serovar Ranarum str. ICFT]
MTFSLFALRSILFPFFGFNFDPFFLIRSIVFPTETIRRY